MIRLLSLAVIAIPAFFHAHLTSSFPRANDVVRRAPTEIRLAYSEAPVVKLTSIKLLRADSTAVELSKPAVDKDTLAVTAKIPAALPTGTYAVVWRTASRDGHVIRGRYVFTWSTTAPAPADAAVSAAASEHAHH